MTIEQLKEAFDRHSDEYLKHEKIPLDQRLSNRPDLHAFLLLDDLMPGTTNIISASAHDEFWLDIDAEQLAGVITDEQVLTLVRCGVRFDANYNSIAFFT